MKFLSTTITVFCIFLLTACGGGGGGSDGGGNVSSSTPVQPTNTPPTVNISGAAEADSGDVVSLTANATDSDGTIASYAWAVDSGSITLNDASKAQVSFTAPSVDSDTTISLVVTVSDNKGTTAKATKQIMVKKKVSLTITGLVLDGGAVPNADVTFTVGDSTFTTKANAAGQYSITISAGSKNVNTPVLATAVGDATNPKIKLASQLYSVSKLTKQADSDTVLEAKENLSVNISNVTTAEYAILKTPTSWGFITPIGTDEQLQKAQKSIDSSKKVVTASYLQIIATDSRFKLPDASKNTLDFLQDQAAVNDFSDQLKATDSALISNTEMLIKSDKNLIYTKGSIAGQYLLSDHLEFNPHFFRLTLNNDHTGILEGGGFAVNTSISYTSSFTTSLTWAQDSTKVTLSFPTPVETGDIDYFYRYLLNSAELSISLSTPDFSSGYFKLLETYIYKDDSNRRGSTEKLLYVTAYDTAKFVPLTAEKIAGEWMSDSGSYYFNADKTGRYKSYTGYDYQWNWSIDNNKLVVGNSNANSSDEIYLSEDLGVGYSYLRLRYSFETHYFNISHGWLIKPQTNLQLKKADFVGLWIDNTSPFIRVMSSNNQFFENIDEHPNIWSSIEGSNTWEKTLYRNNNDLRQSCDLSIGTHPDCRIYENYTNKVVAVNGDQYYSLQTVTNYFNPDKPSVNFSLVQSTRLPEINYFGDWMKLDLIRYFYQKTETGVQVWNFLGNAFIIDNKSLDTNINFRDAIKFSLKNNRLQYTRDNIARELMLIGASENGLTVCEYNQGASCVAGTEFLLSNSSPAKISLKVEGSGTITYSEKLSNTGIYALFGHSLKFTLTPDAGAIVKSVTGCGGHLNGNSYTTPEIRDACTITATFTKLP